MAAHNTLARLSLLSGLGLTFQQGPGASFSVCLPHLESVRHVRTGLVQQHDSSMLLPFSLEVFIQPKGIVPESAVLVRSFSLVFSYLCTQRCGTVCECRESLVSHPFSYESWWNRAREAYYYPGKPTLKPTTSPVAAHRMEELRQGKVS